MKKLILFIIIFGIIGLVIGYLFFGKIAGDYINLKTIFSVSENALQSFGRKISGLEDIKKNILISGGIGGIIGIIIFYLKKK